MVVHSKPFIKIIGILLLMVRFVKISDQAIIQIIRKNKSILMFLLNPGNYFTGTYLKPSQQVFAVLLVCSLQPSTNAAIVGVLDPPLELYNCSKICVQIK